MHTQRDLFCPMLAQTHGRQGDFFENAGDLSSCLHCEQCGDYLVRTEGGFLCCPNGHGKLRIQATGDAERDIDNLLDAALFAEAAEVHRDRGETAIAEQYERLVEQCRL